MSNAPIQHPIVSEKNGIITKPWILWFTAIAREIDGGGP